MNQSDKDRRDGDTYYCAKRMFEEARIPVTPYASTLRTYSAHSHVRLDNIVRIVRKQVMLYSSLKDREMKTPNEKWPNTERAWDTQGRVILRPTPPREAPVARRSSSDVSRSTERDLYGSKRRREEEIGNHNEEGNDVHTKKV